MTEMFYIIDKHTEGSGMNRTVFFLKTDLVLYTETFWLKEI